IRIALGHLRPRRERAWHQSPNIGRHHTTSDRLLSPRIVRRRPDAIRSRASQYGRVLHRAPLSLTLCRRVAIVPAMAKANTNVASSLTVSLPASNRLRRPAQAAIGSSISGCREAPPVPLLNFRSAHPARAAACYLSGGLCGSGCGVLPEGAPPSLLERLSLSAPVDKADLVASHRLMAPRLIPCPTWIAPSLICSPASGAGVDSAAAGMPAASTARDPARTAALIIWRMHPPDPSYSTTARSG